MSLLNRYRDAYVVARSIDGTGDAIKIAGFIVAILVGVGGCYAGREVNGGVGILGLLFGAALAIPFYVLGVLVSAQGQILKATIDTAVNTSPLLSEDEIRSILSLVPGEQSDASQSLASSRSAPQAVQTQLCPKCGAIHPLRAIDCTCGHKFATTTGEHA